MGSKRRRADSWVVLILVGPSYPLTLVRDAHWGVKLGYHLRAVVLSLGSVRLEKKAFSAQFSERPPRDYFPITKLLVRNNFRFARNPRAIGKHCATYRARSLPRRVTCRAFPSSLLPISSVP